MPLLPGGHAHARQTSRYRARLPTSDTPPRPKRAHAPLPPMNNENSTAHASRERERNGALCRLGGSSIPRQIPTDRLGSQSPGQSVSQSVASFFSVLLSSDIKKIGHAGCAENNKNRRQWRGTNDRRGRHTHERHPSRSLPLGCGPRMRRASWMSLTMTVTRLRMVQRLASSKSPTRCASAASSSQQRRRLPPVLAVREVQLHPFTSRANGSFRISSSVDRWYLCRAKGPREREAEGGGGRGRKGEGEGTANHFKTAIILLTADFFQRPLSGSVSSSPPPLQPLE